MASPEFNCAKARLRQIQSFSIIFPSRLHLSYGTRGHPRPTKANQGQTRANKGIPAKG